jgi:hypothetical protein
MSPDGVDALDDEIWDAMVRHIQAEADAIRAQQNKLPKSR